MSKIWTEFGDGRLAVESDEDHALIYIIYIYSFSDEVLAIAKEELDSFIKALQTVQRHIQVEEL